MDGDGVASASRCRRPSSARVWARYATTKEYGQYDYYGTLKALAAKGFTVVSEIRSRDSEIAQSGDRVAEQIRVLLNAGVPAGNVSVVGFSEGGAIAIAAAAALANPNVKFVVMAGCWDGPRFRKIVAERAALMKGRMLSIYDAGDTEARSCADAFAKAGDGFAGEETVLHAKVGHGLFYRPRSEWLNPVTEWLLHW